MAKNYGISNSKIIADLIQVVSDGASVFVVKTVALE